MSLSSLLRCSNGSLGRHLCALPSRAPKTRSIAACTRSASSIVGRAPSLRSLSSSPLPGPPTFPGLSAKPWRLRRDYASQASQELTKIEHSQFLSEAPPDASWIKRSAAQDPNEEGAALEDAADGKGAYSSDVTTETPLLSFLPPFPSILPPHPSPLHFLTSLPNCASNTPS